MKKNEEKYPFACDFIQKVQQKIEELFYIYRNSKDTSYIKEIYINNYEKINKMYPESDKKQSLLKFIKNYKKTHDEIINSTYYLSKDFFINPLDNLY